MVQLGICLLHKHENLSLDSQNPCKKLVMVAYNYNSALKENSGREGGILKVHQPASQSSQINELEVQRENLSHK